VANASPGTGALAVIYPADAGSAYLPVPGVVAIPGSAVTTDANGRYQFYAADGRYDLTVTGTGITTTTVADEGDGNDEFYQKITSLGSGLQIPSTITVEQDAYSGGVNEYPTGLATKTQFQPIRFNLIGRTIGERKGIQGFVQSYGKGDNIGIMASANDFGGYSTGGDEGSEGGRFMTAQGDGTATGGFASGTVSAVSSNLVTGTWTSSSNATLGEQRPLINTSRAVYSTGTISAVTGTSPCTVTGVGTGWTALGTGPKTDLFLNISGNDNGTVKHVVPITSITDDTHLVLEYNLAELGATGFGSTMVASGAYNIYKGGMVTSLGTAGTDGNATSVNLSSGGSNFQVGDTIQQPLGYNYHGRGVQVALSRLVGETQGGGVYVDNTGTIPFRDAFRASGPFLNGLLFDSGTLSGHGLLFTNPVTGALVRTSDITAGSQTLVQTLSSGLSPRSALVYNRTSDYFQLGNGTGGALFIDGSSTRLSTNSTPQANVQFYLGYAGAAFNGFIVGPTTAPNAGVYQLQTQTNGGVVTFGVDAGTGRVVTSNSMNLEMYSGAFGSRVVQIIGSNGNINTAGTITAASFPSPVITGTPSGSGIPTLTLKKGSGGGAYSGSNTGFADVDSTNLSYTVTIPTGWKLAITCTLGGYQSTGAATLLYALSDNGSQLPGVIAQDVTTVVKEQPMTLVGLIIGDGASHTIRLQAATSVGADAWNIVNSSSTRTPVMLFTLTPSN
jgi:hypothetical protein